MPAKMAVLTKLDEKTVRALDQIAEAHEWTRSHVVRRIVEQSIAAKRHTREAKA